MSYFSNIKGNWVGGAHCSIGLMARTSARARVCVCVCVSVITFRACL